MHAGKERRNPIKFSTYKALEAFEKMATSTRGVRERVGCYIMT